MGIDFVAGTHRQRAQEIESTKQSERGRLYETTESPRYYNAHNGPGLISSKEVFEEYAEKAKSLPPTTKDADKLILYGLYKQATVGAINTNRPGLFSPKERAKWDSWKA
ncbi:hypothetical protein RJ639_026805, partial [Escallonia herrerae]